MNQANKPPVSDTTLPSPVVEQDGESVIMSFDEVSVQSRMRLDDPTALDLDYSRVMMAFLLLQPQPESILMIGLGGGSLAKYCHRHLPQARITAAFEAVAAQRSVDDATRYSGGDLGYRTIDVMPEAYKNALRDRPAGSTVGPFQTEGGWAVLRVEDRRRETPPTLEQARPQIVRYLTYEGVRQLLQQLLQLYTKRIFQQYHADETLHLLELMQHHLRQVLSQL